MATVRRGPGTPKTVAVTEVYALLNAILINNVTG